MLISVPFGYEVPSLMKSPSRTYDVSIVCSCRCLAISLPGSIVRRATAGPKDGSLFKTFSVAVPLVLGNGAGIDCTLAVLMVCVKRMAFFSFLNLSRWRIWVRRAEFDRRILLQAFLEVSNDLRHRRDDP